MPFMYAIMTALCLLGAGPAWGTGPVDATWRKVSEDDGIIGYARPNARCRIDEIKAIGIVEAPVAVVEAVIRDVPHNKDFMFMCKESAILEFPGIKNTTDEYVTYALVDMPFPVSDRDAVARVNWTMDKTTGTLYAAGQSLPTDFRLKAGVVRMPLVAALYTLRPIGPDKTEVTYQAMSDPGGNLPARLVSLLSHNLGVKTIAGIRKMAKQGRYQHCSVITTTLNN